MKVKLYHYMHAVNGLSLQLIPEGEIESQLLAAMFTHGKMEANAGEFRIHFAIPKESDAQPGKTDADGERVAPKEEKKAYYSASQR